MSNLSIAELAAIAAQTEDQTTTKAGGDYEYTPPPAGPAAARFVEYIELGKSKQKPYQGKAKPDAEFVRLTFELLSKRNIKEIELEGGVKKTVADRISITINKNFGENAKFKKLFNKMVYGREGIKHFAQMLGQSFIVTVFHNKEGDKTYVNLNDADGNWFVGAPRMLIGADPLSGAEGEWKDISIPEAISPLRIFLWDNPTKETWDTLFIDGERDVKDAAGVVTKESKNWLQARIKSATNYGGSALEQLLGGVAELPATEEEANEAEGKSASTVAGTTIQQQTASPSDAALAELEQSKPAATTAADDLAAIGL